MASLFDSLGPEWRAPDIVEAVRSMAESDAGDRGAVFTRPEIVDAILDLSGYTADRRLLACRLLEPSFGQGDFLLPAVTRLLDSIRREGDEPAAVVEELANALRAVEIGQAPYSHTRTRLLALLQDYGIGEHDAGALCAKWLICDDFLLCDLTGEFDVVVGNPPYVRQERIPAALLAEYRARFRTLYDRADLYVPFYERALDLLAPNGVLGFICANRWLKNRYGGPLRNKIAGEFHLTHFIDMESSQAFQTEVIAYPAITIIRRPRSQSTSARVTRIARRAAAEGMSLQELSRRMGAPESSDGAIDEIALGDSGDAPWLFDESAHMSLLRRLERLFPTLEQSGCKVGIGVATGCDRAFIGDHDALDIEDERKLPLVMARDLIDDGRIVWGGKGLANPFEDDGRLVELSRYPRFAKYLERHADVIRSRHVAMRDPTRWHRTIDRVQPGLLSRPKLLIPDIKGEAMVALDEGCFYPHHNLYFVTSDQWDLAALQTVLRSSIGLMMIASYSTRMAGGFLRFQAQYLRRIRVPQWTDVPPSLRADLATAARRREQIEIDAPVFELFGMDRQEQSIATEAARAARVTGAGSRGK
jgi:hypothetical protein